jgi:PleD family two-component response regulator
MLRDDDRSSEKFFSRADTALYKAKEQGRNRVAVLP